MNSEYNFDLFRAVVSVACGIAGFLWGQLDGLLLAIIAFMVLDYITGLTVAFLQKKLSSEKGFVGLARKGITLAIIAIGHIIDMQIFGGETSMCRSAVIGFYLANEGLSILENAGKIGIPLPKILTKTLEQLKKGDDDDDEP